VLHLYEWAGKMSDVDSAFPPYEILALRSAYPRLP